MLQLFSRICSFRTALKRGEFKERNLVCHEVNLRCVLKECINAARLSVDSVLSKKLSFCVFSMSSAVKIR